MKRKKEGKKIQEKKEKMYNCSIILMDTEEIYSTARSKSENKKESEVAS